MASVMVEPEISGWGLPLPLNIVHIILNLHSTQPKFHAPAYGGVANIIGYMLHCIPDHATLVGRKCMLQDIAPLRDK